ncbi:MAG: hypothetical protein A2Z72_08835 [Omnitrophica bacterium RBG_13_46_9]|nr:MAG: hypothetical protein A2Z72_08835 [Omnitrophica bacterium RBG_13_46_9]
MGKFFEIKKTGFTLTELTFVVLFIGIFIVLLAPFVSKIRHKAKIIACEENLQKIGLGLDLYASENQGKFPPDLNELLKSGYVADEKVFDCPSSPHIGSTKEPDYTYTAGYTILSPSDTVIVCDDVVNHKDGKHVLYISGDIKWEERMR